MRVGNAHCIAVRVLCAAMGAFLTRNLAIILQGNCKYLPTLYKLISRKIEVVVVYMQFHLK